MKAAAALVLAASTAACADPFEALLPNTSTELILARQNAELYHRLDDRLDDTERFILATRVSNALVNAQVHAGRNLLPFRDRSIMDGAAEDLCFLLLNPDYVPVSQAWEQDDTIETLESILENVELSDEQREGRHCSVYFQQAVVASDTAE